MSRWIALIYRLRPGSEQAVEEIFRGSGRPEHDIRSQDGALVGRLLTSLVFMGEEIAVRVSEFEGDVKEISRHLSRQPEVRAFESAIGPYLAVPRDMTTPEGAAAFFRTWGLRCVMVRRREPDEDRGDEEIRFETPGAASTEEDMLGAQTLRDGPGMLVAGATGLQGGAVAREFLRRGWRVRALTRDPGKPAAQSLRSQGAELVKGDLDDRASLDVALRGVSVVFSVQNFYEHGYNGEVYQGKQLADAAKDARVSHFIYSSVGGADRSTGIPHFQSKWIVEQHIQAVDLPATIFRPASFMENFFMPNFRLAILEGTLPSALRPGRSQQMIAVHDIGHFAALACERPDEFIGRAIEIAGDEVTMEQAAAVFSQAIGKPVRYKQVPIERLRSFNAEVAQMYEWLNESGYQADIPALRALHPAMMTLETWVGSTGWNEMAAQQNTATT